MNIKTALHEAAGRLAAAGIDTPLLDAQVLLAHVTGAQRVHFYAHPEEDLEPGDETAFLALVARRERREPVAYLTGVKEFYGLDFRVGPGILIPRPDTEVLVEKALSFLGTLEKPCPKVLDLCSGSGCIGLSVAKNHPVRLTLSDLSQSAVETGRENARSLGVAARILKGDLFSSVPDGEKFDLILSNPPYIPEGDICVLSPEISRYEPRLALSGGASGYEIYERLIREAPDYLRTGGLLLMEFGDGQSARIAEMLRTGGFHDCFVISDLSGSPRAAGGQL